MLNFLKRMFQKSGEGLAEVLRNGAVIVDVRSQSEFEQGHIAGSRNIPLNEIKQKTEMIRKWNKPVVTVCRTGNRSRMAKAILTAAGVSAYNGGAWNILNTK